MEATYRMACRMALLAMFAMVVLFTSMPGSAEAGSRKMLQTPTQVLAAIVNDYHTQNYAQLSTDINDAANEFLDFDNITQSGTGHWQTLPFGYHTGGGTYTGSGGASGK